MVAFEVPFTVTEAPLLTFNVLVPKTLKYPELAVDALMVSEALLLPLPTFKVVPVPCKIKARKVPPLKLRVFVPFKLIVPPLVAVVVPPKRIVPIPLRLRLPLNVVVVPDATPQVPAEARTMLLLNVSSTPLALLVMTPVRLNALPVIV